MNIASITRSRGAAITGKEHDPLQSDDPAAQIANPQLQASPKIRQKRFVASILVLLWLAAIVLSSQILAGGFQPELHDPDEPAHFVTGVMIYEFLRAGQFTAPVEFAEAFYQRHPKVAFGHWPPLYHLAQGLWYCGTGPTKASALLLTGAFAIMTGWCLFHWLQARTSPLSALIASSLFLVMPLPRLHSTRVSSEMMVELLCLLGMISLIRSLEAHSRRSLAIFMLCIAMGFLTKETVLPLVFCLPFAVILSRQTTLLRNRQLWFAVCLGISVSLLFALWKMSGESGWHGMRSFHQLGHWFWTHGSLSDSLAEHLALAHPMVLTIAGLGVAAHWLGADGRPWDPVHHWPSSQSVAGAASMAVLLASIGFGWLIGAIERRYFMPAILPLMVFFALGIESVRRCIALRSRPLAVFSVLLLGITSVAFSMDAFPARTKGFSRVAGSINVGRSGAVILISSDSPGEGSFIVERMIQDDMADTRILRASKVLGRSAWSGEGYALVHPTQAEMLHFLTDFPVDYIVYDHQAWGEKEPEEHHPLLLQALRSDPLHFPEIETFPLIRGDQQLEEAISVFRNQGNEVACRDSACAQASTCKTVTCDRSFVRNQARKLK